MANIRNSHGRYKMNRTKAGSIIASNTKNLTDGVYAVPRNPNEYRVKVRALDAYCKERGIEPKELSKNEMEQFLVKPMTESH